MSILKKNKSLSKKIIAIVIGSTVLIVGGGYIYTENIKSKEINTEMVSREREYQVEKDDIVAGINGSGKIKSNQVTQNFEESVTIDEIFVKVGQKITKGEKIASLSTTKINEKIKELNNQLKELNTNNQSGEQSGTPQQNTQENVPDQNTQNGEPDKEPQENTPEQNIQNGNQDKEPQENTSEQNTQDENPDKEVQNNELDENIQNEIDMKSKSREVNTYSENNQEDMELKSREGSVNPNTNTNTNSGVDTSSKDEIKKQIAKLEKLKKSPILYSKSSGIVFDIGYSKGEETLTDKPVVTIAEEGDIFAEIPVSQDDILNLEVGQQVNIWSSAYEGEKFSGKIDFINLKPNSENGSTTFTVTVKLDKTSNELLDGMSISSQFIFKELKDVLTLSNKAITLKDGKQMVKVRQEDNTLKEKVITTGFSDGKKSEITSGLKEGDTVIVGGE